MPVAAGVWGSSVSAAIIALPEFVRRRTNRDRTIEPDSTGETVVGAEINLDAEWKRVADTWRRRYM
jgi:hypothetical protein